MQTTKLPFFMYRLGFGLHPSDTNSVTPIDPEGRAGNHRPPNSWPESAYSSKHSAQTRCTHGRLHITQARHTKMKQFVCTSSIDYVAQRSPVHPKIPGRLQPQVSWQSRLTLKNDQETLVVRTTSNRPSLHDRLFQDRYISLSRLVNVGSLWYCRRIDCQ